MSFTRFTYQEVTGFKFEALPLLKTRMYSIIYYVDGLLIDTGHPKAHKNVVLATKELKINQVFLTHFHEDHSGNLNHFQTTFHPKIYASDLCCKMMKSPPKLSFAQKILWGNRKPFLNLSPKKDVIKTDNYQFTIIPIPGHSDDMVALYEPNKKWLFSADLYINSYIGYMLKNESIAQQIQSIKTILKLDFNVLFCGHNPQLTHGKEKLKEKMNFLESFFEDVKQLYQKGYTSKEIFKQLQLKEMILVTFLSGGSLSKMNMVKSVIRDLEANNL